MICLSECAMTERKIIDSIALLTRVMRRTVRSDKRSYNCARRVLITLNAELRRVARDRREEL